MVDLSPIGTSNIEDYGPQINQDLDPNPNNPNLNYPTPIRKRGRQKKG
jgi:hypothetical protein